MATKQSLLKNSIFALLPLIVLLVIGEVGGRIVYYQRLSAYPFALVQLFERLQNTLAQRATTRHAQQLLAKMGIVAQGEAQRDFQAMWDEYKDALTAPAGKEVIAAFQQEYETYFQQLLAEIQALHAQLVVLNLATEPDVRAFFRQLTQTYQVDLVDASAQLQQYPFHWISLWPQDAHLSRLGHRLVADELARYLDAHAAYRASVNFDQRPARFGNLSPNSDRIWYADTPTPYKVITNGQGLRMEYDLAFPKTQQRILVLGDSFTFGPFLPNPHLYPNMLDAAYQDKEVINAGVMGYTLPDELVLLRAKAKYVEPDIVVLQVYNNDLRDLSFFKRFGSGGKFEISPVEAEFVKEFNAHRRPAR